MRMSKDSVKKAETYMRMSKDTIKKG